MLLQSAKKATTAAQFHVDASKKEAEYGTLQKIGCHNLMSQLDKVVGGGDSTQYPSTSSWLKVPHDVFTEGRARECMGLAEEILKLCCQFTK